jgi:hypothetical protein
VSAALFNSNIAQMCRLLSDLRLPLPKAGFPGCDTENCRYRTYWEDLLAINDLGYSHPRKQPVRRTVVIELHRTDDDLYCAGAHIEGVSDIEFFQVSKSFN